MCSRILEWKEVGFKGFGDNVPKIHLMEDEEKNEQKKLDYLKERMNAFWSWE